MGGSIIRPTGGRTSFYTCLPYNMHHGIVSYIKIEDVALLVARSAAAGIPSNKENTCVIASEKNFSQRTAPLLCLPHVFSKWTDMASQMESEGVVTSVSFGPEVKIGDTITVEVDVVKKEVIFYRNQARIYWLDLGSRKKA